jgi:hypothetical protein
MQLSVATKAASLRLVARPESTIEVSVGIGSPIRRGTLGAAGQYYERTTTYYRTNTTYAGFMPVSCRDSAVPLAPE